MVMRPIGDTILSPAAVSAIAAGRSRALQKAIGASGLRGDGRDEPQQKQAYQHKATRARMHHNGTEGAVPFRHVRLTAAFTAQLLGQILPDPERRPSAAAAYEREVLPLSLGFDTEL
jgi:hypothetical protein